MRVVARLHHGSFWFSVEVTTAEGCCALHGTSEARSSQGQREYVQTVRSMLKLVFEVIRG